ncbi:hypothetical protein AB0P36_28890 [Streptomyces flavidovirens]|uniref:hypothetical protein n=1 Tax=Streptomyces flavidovirens TaxID=67298 RepID=UPI003431D3F2
MAPETTLPEPVNLTDPYAHNDPAPSPDCDVCAELVKQGREARESGDLSKVTDCLVEISRHSHGRRT